MHNLNVCRICLAANLRMYDILNTSLQEIFERLTCLPLHNKDGPKLVCYLCVARLRNAQRLYYVAVESDNVLTKILRNNLIGDNPVDIQTDILSWKLSVLVLENIEITNGESEVKNEEVDYPIKVEEAKEDLYNDAPLSDVENTDLHDNASIKEQSDSEDDLPLTNLTATKHESDRGRGKSKRKYNTDTKVDAVEIILTYEQQVNELRERAKSLNYLNSPYKCDYCYKGFLQQEAYENHKERHSKSSGELECGVCRLRYGSARQLRAHRAAAHERRYACTRCKHRAHTKNQAIAHEKWHDGHIYPCELCGEKFSKPTSYLTHARTAHGGGHACAQCGRSFVGRHGLAMHVSKANCTPNKDMQEEPSEKRFCEDCGIRFNSFDAWKRHVLTSIKHRQWNDKRPDCSICEVRLSSSNWRSHMRTHARAMRAANASKDTGDRCEPLVMLNCDQCESKFSSQSRLHAHVRRVHLGVKYNKNFVCEVCGKKCTSGATLRYHQRRHTGERPYACSACPARFADGHRLRVHARVHSGERPYACERCGKRFSQKPALNRHYRVHTGAKPYECHLCSKSFSQSNSMKLHVNMVHLKLAPHKKRGVPVKT